MGSNVSLWGIGDLAAWAALDAGLSLDAAYRLGKVVSSAAAGRARDLMGVADCWPPVPPTVLAVDWHALRERAGRPDWVPPDGGGEAEVDQREADARA